MFSSCYLLTNITFADLLSFADDLAFGRLSKKQKKTEIQDEDSSDASAEEPDMSLGSEDEDDMDDDLDSEQDEMFGEEEDDLTKFYTDDEEDEEDVELTRNTALNAQSTLSNVPTPPLDPAPIAGKYVPPSLRRAQEAAAAAVAAGPPEASTSNITNGAQAQPKSAEQIKLERKVQGSLNKLSEANIEGILGEVEALYRDWSRNGKHNTRVMTVDFRFADRMLLALLSSQMSLPP